MTPPPRHPALDLFERGLHLTVIPWGEKLHGKNGWESSPRMSADELGDALSFQTNFGVLTGEPSGAFVLDVDPKGGAMEAMSALVAAYGPMPQTLVVATPSGGWHYFYEMPGFEVRNSQSKIGPGIDIRGTGGYVVGAGSWTRLIEGRQSEGSYQIVNPAPIARAPEWLREWLWGEHQKRGRGAEAGTKAAVEANYDPTRSGDYAVYEQRAVEGELQRLADLARPWQEGAGWDLTTFEVACSLTEIANAAWSSLTADQVEALLLEHAPSDGSWGEPQILDKLTSARRRIGDKARPTPQLRPKVDLLAGATPLAATEMVPVTLGAGSTGAASREAIDVGNPAKATEWLRENLGIGVLSGVFRRGNDVVFTPRIGEKGYTEPRMGTSVNGASITPMNHYQLIAVIQSRYAPYRFSEVADETGTKKRIMRPELFPAATARLAVEKPDEMTALRELGGVIHVPSFRPDGSLISAPGYDPITKLAFLPDSDRQMPSFPEVPTPEDVQKAVGWIGYMLQDFAFVSADDKANYIGLMLTPMLRSMLKPPFKLGVIEAHQPGSGKTFLARALVSIHSGVMHSEMPSEEAELVKTVTSILDTSTGAVVAFDNVSGIVRSSTLAGLLTSPTFQGRRLGTGTMVEATNDRLWIITGNNAVLGGDLPRRALRVQIDPGVPNPENRTEFAIKSFESWVHENRGVLLWSLIVLIRNWVAQGSPMPEKVRADSYGHWAAVIGSILRLANIEGTFDDPVRAAQDVDPDSTEWEAFLAAVYALHGENAWTAKQVLAQVAPPIDGLTSNQAHPIPHDLLPGSLLANRNGSVAPLTLARTFGRYLMNREGRWFGPYAVRRYGGSRREGAVVWRVAYHPR